MVLVIKTKAPERIELDADDCKKYIEASKKQNLLSAVGNNQNLLSSIADIESKLKFGKPIFDLESTYSRAYKDYINPPFHKHQSIAESLAFKECEQFKQVHYGLSPTDLAMRNSPLARLLNPTCEELLEQQRIEEEKERSERLAQSMRLMQQQQDNHKEKMIEIQVEALRIIEAEKAKIKTESHEITTAPPVQNDVKPKEKISINQLRDNDFLAWIESEKPPLDKMTKPQIHARLIERNSDLWRRGEKTFEKFWEQQDIYKASRGRKPTTNR